ncbi:hypothetical protein M758_10G091100 [Ceratodon purpureus]|uniref:S-protein homolog n=1 Tax=Ceratodon purpureus TaxID=3225 RepID=A0A8T0GL35_CERPU|nr:hypothetical protein KC19_10G092700 [Ceratodon purpureus]KAG0603402.1 hypothetical protein M758_10G091100 [Ceratodon purpureus]
MAPNLGIMMLCIFMLGIGGVASWPWDKGSVTINNRLTVNLKVFCHSAEDDLAVQMMTPSSVYKFSFRQDIFGRTLFTCDFNAVGYGYAGIKVWEGFDYSSRRCVCTRCTWDVTGGGFGCNGKLIYAWSPA